MSEKSSSFAADARTFLAQNRYALLSTVSASQGGFPFGSIVPYDLNAAGEPVIYVSLIAEHYKNLIADDRASLVAANYFAYQEPQAFARATMLCRFKPVPAEEREAVMKSYQEKFPNSINHEIAHNFLFVRGTVERIRWIGGFGNIGWVNADKYAAAEPDPLARHSFEIIEHMNEDHADALRDYLRAYGKGDPKSGSVQMIEINSASFAIAHHSHGAHQVLTIPFASPVTTPEEARAALIKLLKEVRGSGG